MMAGVPQTAKWRLWARCAGGSGGWARRAVIPASLCDDRLEHLSRGPPGVLAHAPVGVAEELDDRRHRRAGAQVRVVGARLRQLRPEILQTFKTILRPC